MNPSTLSGNTQVIKQIPWWEWSETLHVMSVALGWRETPGICSRIGRFIPHPLHFSSLGGFCYPKKAGNVAGVIST